MNSGKQKIILVVEDEEPIRKLIKGMLKEYGFNNVIEARDGAQALKILLDEPVDLILADWRMPEMNGLELLKKVRATKKISDIPFVMVSSVDEKDDIVAAMKARVSQYIIKPFSSKDFHDKLEPFLAS